MNNKPDVFKLHEQFESVTSEGNNLLKSKDSYKNVSKTKFPYEFLISVDRGWVPCDVLEADPEKELVKVIFYHPDSVGWMETCAGGLFDEVIPMWRVRLRED